MTREAGAELDAMVAEMMGYGRYEVRPLGETEPVTCWVLQRGTVPVDGNYSAQHLRMRWSPPNYSTSIEAAWEVVEKMRALGWSVNIVWNCSTKIPDFDRSIEKVGGPVYGDVLVGFGRNPEGCIQGRADTAPLAISLAALAAVGK